MNVLHVVSNLDPSSGGPAEALRGLASAQVAAGLAVGVLSTWARGADLSFADRLRAAGVEVHLIGPCYSPLVWRPGLGRAVAAAVRAADVVHIHALWEEVQHQAARACLRFGRPYVFRPCGMLDPWSLAQGGWKKRLYLRLRLRRNLDGAAALHFTTPIERDLVAPLGLTAPAVVEPNGIRPDEFRDPPPPAEFRTAQSIPVAAPLLLFLGRVHHKKGLDLLPPVLAALPGVYLVIAGPDQDGYGNQVLRHAEGLGVADRVRFVGMVRGREKLAALTAADLFVLPSHQENFGNAVVEALAVGLPVVISDQVNLWPEIRDAGVGGVAPLRVDALTEVIRRWLASPELRADAGRKAIPWVRERYDWATIARRWAGHYRSFLSRQPLLVS
jgi:glycosyltransferase involved in cell wall biosynthesis